MTDGYQNEDYWNEDYQNDIISEKLSHNAEVSSGSEHGSAESVVLDQQGYENVVQEYEYIAFSGIRLRRLPEKQEERQPALYTFEDAKWGPFGRKPFRIFSILLLCSLIMAIAALIMACLRCKCKSEEGFPGCPNDWYKFQEKCYYYSTKGMNHDEARSYCQDLGADLIIIDNENEQDFLKDELQISKETWIGLIYPEAERKWMWVDFKNLSYVNWKRKTAPSSISSEQQKQNCAILKPDYENKWESTECQRRYHFICEKGRHVACVLQSPFLPH